MNEAEKLVDLVKDANINWCIDIFERIDIILNQSSVTASDIEQIHWLVKQGLKAKKEE